ncbi:uncharacterized protein LOC131617593 [Vicia villosa]|uniref:uncharacterized protein LOC131617593 n=1 Tax=Vicia villosa TaxID=3911 RepID=UPI00273B8C21|nr:uncharacterized protein LOC131617593 [Vicia villosa]
MIIGVICQEPNIFVAFDDTVDDGAANIFSMGRKSHAIINLEDEFSIGSFHAMKKGRLQILEGTSLNTFELQGELWPIIYAFEEVQGSYNDLFCFSSKSCTSTPKIEAIISEQ